MNKHVPNISELNYKTIFTCIDVSQVTYFDVILYIILLL